MFKNIFTIAKNTFRETIRDRILLSGLFVIIAMILFSLFIASISLDQSTRVIINFSVTAIYALQMFVAIFIGSMLIYKEIERKTFYLILPKPLSRTEIVLGKCLGLTTTTILVTLSSTLVLVIMLALKNEHAYYGNIFLSVFLSTLEAAFLILVSMLFSSFTSPILAAVSTVAIFFVGHAGGVFRYIFTTTQSPFLEWLMKGLYYLFPNLEKFNIRNDIVSLVPHSFSAILIICLYALTYAVFVVFLTHIVFKKKDF